MKITLDARMIGHSGIGTCIRGLLSGLTPEQLGMISLIGDPEKLKGYDCRIVPAYEGIYGWREQIAMPSRLRRLAPDVHHSPHYNIPLGHGGKLITTVHDLIPLLFPRFSRLPLARFYARGMIAMVARKSARILADSECTRRDLIRYGVPAEKIVVMPVGLDARFRPVETEEMNGHLSRHGLTPGYILYLGNIRKIKNVPRLLKAYGILRENNKDVPPLVLAGQDQMPDETAPYRNQASIRFLGKVDMESLPSLYRGASVFAFPSLYEGFGLPPLEAMACGTPVVASTGGSLPEVLGDAALTPDPNNVDAIAGDLLRVLSDTALRKTLVERGLRQAAKFEWKNIAARTFQIYQDVVLS